MWIMVSLFNAPEIEIEDWGHIVFVLSVIMLFCPPLWNFNLANNFWTVSARALIFQINSLWQNLSVGTIIFYPVPLTLEFDPFFENFYLTNNFWAASARALVFKWVFFVTRLFHGYHNFVPRDLDLGVWPIFWKL